MICFGASWPVSIAKALRCKRSEGKSALFGVILLLGYGMGLIHKWGHGRDWVMWLYVLNAAMVAVDLALCVHYRRHPGRGDGKEGRGERSMDAGH